jgi:hypothetical protein
MVQKTLSPYGVFAVLCCRFQAAFFAFFAFFAATTIV